MTRKEFDAQFAATEQSTDFRFDRAILRQINDAMFEAVQGLDESDDIAKSVADHAFEAEVARL